MHHEVQLDEAAYHGPYVLNKKHATGTTGRRGECWWYTCRWQRACEAVMPRPTDLLCSRRDAAAYRRWEE